MQNEMIDTLNKMNEYVKKLSVALDSGKLSAEEFRDNACELISVIEMLNSNLPKEIIASYIEFFMSFQIFCKKCNEIEFLKENVDYMASSLELFGECIQQIIKEYSNLFRICTCCENYVIYTPLRSCYKDATYLCPSCQATDRDRLIIAFLKKAGLQQAKDTVKLLQFAPSMPVESWILDNCPHITYESADLYLENVTFQADIQDMQMIDNETYDVVICSQVLEHVKDDAKALIEMKRIIRKDGMILFLMPEELSTETVDQESGFKKALLEKLREQFCVNELGIDYFGEETFHMGGFTNTSTLYVMTKSENVQLDVSDVIEVDEELCKNGPLVSVIMSCYNHEKYVAAAIESVLNQTYQNIEFLVADDGSSDKSAEIMKQYSSHFAKEFYYEENTGSRFQLLKDSATGKYTALMNSDDIWDKDKIALQVAYMEAHKECGACFTWCIFTDENLNLLSDKVFIQKNRTRYEWMLFFWTVGNALCNPSSLIPTELNKQIPNFGTACWQLPDFFKWVNMVQDHAIHIITKPLTFMRKTGKNASSSTAVNGYRHAVEEGNNWILFIKNMDPDFFFKAFSSLMIYPKTISELGIKCEKYFLLLNHQNAFVQNSAFCYFSEIYNEVKDFMKENYHYGIKEFKEDCIRKGFADKFLS